MTDSTDRVLAAIDETIDGYASEDWTVSGDAMRWRPGEPEEPRTVQVFCAPRGTLADGPTAWTELGYTTADGLRLGDETHTFADLEVERLQRAVRSVTEVIVPQFQQLQRSIAQVGKAFRSMVNGSHPVLAPTVYGDDYRRHRRACRLCNPAGNPKPLKVNGAEYRRRTRARRRRNRR